MDYLLPAAYVFSNPNVVSIFLVKELLSKNLQVIVVTNHKDEFVKYFPENVNLIIKDFRENINKVPAYVFLIQGFSIRNGFFHKSILNTILNFSQSYTPKTEIILPYVVNNETRLKVEYVADQSKKIPNRNLSILYLGEIYGPGMDLFNFNWISLLFNGLWSERSLSIPLYDMELYMVDIAQAISTLIKGIFSYGFGNKENVIAFKKKAYDLLHELQEIRSSTTFISDEKITNPATISNFDFLNVQENKDVLRETVFWVERNKLKPTSKTKNVSSHEKPKIEEKRKIFLKLFRQGVIKKSQAVKISKKRIKKLLLAVFITLVIFAIPFLTLFLSSLTLKMGFQKIETSDLTSADKYFKISKELAIFSKNTFIFFDQGQKASILISDFSDFGNRAVNALQMGAKFEQEIGGSTDYDLVNQSNQLFLDLDDLYKESSFLSVESNLPTSLDFKNIRLYLENSRTLAKNLPSILGMDRQMNYLVLEQDRNELRPTGGLISNLQVFTFERGRLTNKTTYNVKEADKLLKGHIDPPEAIKKYLGQNSWYLRDSNWDPDFRTAASKIEWFVENEMNQTLDGVIVIDSGIFDKINNSNVLDFLKSKDIQVFLDNNDFSTPLNNLNWDGGVSIPTCMGNCLAPWLGIVEANLGGNKINPEISRTSNLLVNLTGTDVINRLEINYKNSGNETYRNFVRVMVPASASFEKAAITINGDQEFLPTDITQLQGRTEGGVLLQILAHESAQIVFTWYTKNTINYNEHGKVLFYMRKQAGVPVNATTINFIMPTFLTQKALTRYNTNLTTDFNKEFDW